jgi:protein SCO1/2
VRNLATITLVILAGAGVLWNATDGFRALTSEQVRRLSIADEPRPVPGVQLQDQDGRAFRFSDYGGRVLVVDFIYTRCPGVCQNMGSAFLRMAERLAPDEVTLLSITFDTAHDTTAALGEYARWHQADGAHWRIARVADPAALPGLLQTFGVVVIPDGFGGYQHNAALHIIDTQGRLSRVIDYEDSVDVLVDSIRRSL